MQDRLTCRPLLLCCALLSVAGCADETSAPPLAVAGAAGEMAIAGGTGGVTTAPPGTAGSSVLGGAGAAGMSALAGSGGSQAGAPTAGAAGAAGQEGAEPEDGRLRVILDSDANNELDDQHAIAYTLFNSDIFKVEGITVNRTSGGGGIENHVAEAKRVVSLCDAEQVPVLRGADASFDDIKGSLGNADFDGKPAVDFIIERARIKTGKKLVLIPIGKLTNVALALMKDPSIAENVRVVWLGSNYPSGGEYNHENDTQSTSYVIESPVEFGIAVVRYGAPSGTDAVQVSNGQINDTMPGLGPKVAPVAGRNGGMFTTFGDYSVNLFEGHPVRPLFDVGGVAMAVNPGWADARVIGAPRVDGVNWQERPDNPRKVTIYENFDKAAIVGDFFATMKQYVLP